MIVGSIDIELDPYGIFYLIEDRHVDKVVQYIGVTDEGQYLTTILALNHKSGYTGLNRGWSKLYHNGQAVAELSSKEPPLNNKISYQELVAIFLKGSK